VRSLGMRAKPWVALVRMVSVPFGFVMRMVLGSGCSIASLDREITGRMNWSGVWGGASTLAVIRTAESVRL